VGFDSGQGLRIVLCPTLVPYLIHLPHNTIIPLQHSTSVCTMCSTKTRLGWTFVSIDCTFVHHDLFFPPPPLLYVEILERSIQVHGCNFIISPPPKKSGCLFIRGFSPTVVLFTERTLSRHLSQESHFGHLRVSCKKKTKKKQIKQHNHA